MPPDAVTRVLIAARKRISEKRHWTRFAMARDAKRNECPGPCPAAVRWCALGALQVECSAVTVTEACWHVDFDESLANRCRHLLEEAAGGRDIAYVNDHRGHAAVLAVFDAAIRGK